MTPHIRQAVAEDLPAILKVLEPWNMHHIPSEEMEMIDFNTFFVAELRGEIVGVSGYKLLSETIGKTTLLAVYPDLQRSGLGEQLQHVRLEAMYKQGIKKVITNADRPDVIVWYQKHFGYRKIGTVDKVMSFGLSHVPRWQTLEMDLEAYFHTLSARSAAKEAYIARFDPHPLSPYPPLIINVCLTGMVPTKRNTPYVPVSVEEIIADAVAVYDAGASIVHIHARDETGRPTSDAVYFEKIITGIRKERPDMICCATTSGRGGVSLEERSEVLFLTGDAKPDMASLTLGSLNFSSGPSINSLDTIQALALTMKEQGIMPELEIFDTGMINVARYLERHGIVNGKKYMNILLGNLSTARATMKDLSHMVDLLPDNTVWAAAGLGDFQLPVNTAAILSGGHVRVGLEDSVYYDYGKSVLATNVMLVERIVRMAKELQRPIASARETRNILGLTSMREKEVQ